ncbi:hypothetical protein D9603_06165 [Pseudoalteromonas sp. PS5]|nr:hypothetical protein D9603_06165 [Pseudoalteromonas sp. PS5]
MRKLNFTLLLFLFCKIWIVTACTKFASLFYFNVAKMVLFLFKVMNFNGFVIFFCKLFCSAEFSGEVFDKLNLINIGVSY